MEYRLSLGGLALRIDSQQELVVNPELVPFFDEGAVEPDVEIQVSWDWDALVLPTWESEGRDLIQDYYFRDGQNWCMTRGGYKGYIAAATYGPEMNRIQCTINAAPFLRPPGSLGSLLRLLPMRALFQYFGVSFFHASQIAVGGKGILFTAPSGTGKSTQARLWNRWEGARILCNDRTLVRQMGEGYRTFGFPIDGSEPVASSETCSLGAVVLLGQGKENRIERLRPVKALSALMPQLVIDGWNPDARIRAGELLMELIGQYPVYRLICTPDEGAVQCLKERLQLDGVIER